MGWSNDSGNRAGSVGNSFLKLGNSQVGITDSQLALPKVIRTDCRLKPNKIKETRAILVATRKASVGWKTIDTDRGLKQGRGRNNIEREDMQQQKANRDSISREDTNDQRQHSGSSGEWDSKKWSRGAKEKHEEITIIRGAVHRQIIKGDDAMAKQTVEVQAKG